VIDLCAVDTMRRTEMTVEALLQGLRAGIGTEARPHALIVILFALGTAAEQVLTFAQQWQRSVPQAALVGVRLTHSTRQPDIAALRRDVAAAAAARAVQMSQIILLGAGEAGRLALDVVLQGIVPAMGIIGIHIAPLTAPPRIDHAAAMVRLVHHRTGEEVPPGFLALVEAMRQRDMDVRTTILPDLAQADLAMTQRAGGTFLAELVANASHFTLATRR
jgi:hypothetical protein